MTREQIEQRIYEHMQEIRKLIEDFCPENMFIDLNICRDGQIMFYNAYWELPNDKRIDFVEPFAED